MAYGIVVDMPAPVEVYDALHGELLRRVGGAVDGLLVHVARATATGFQIVEVWESRQDFDRSNAEVIGPIMTELFGGATAAPDPSGVEEFEVRGLVTAPGPIAW